MTRIPLKYCFTFLLVIYFLEGFSQSNEKIIPIINSFNEYASVPREVAFAHLNKSIYIKGETLAFSAYVFDKGQKKLSKLTKNLYCSILDENGKTIKSNMFLVTNGIANGNFNIDSLFTSGHYTFKAYTNWMKNFNESNFFIENIKIIDPEIENSSAPKVISPKLDAQFLPEGGHLVVSTKNNVGVVVKDSLGFGVPFVKGQILNSKNEMVNLFETNQFGIGKFMFTPKVGESYYALINFEGIEQTVEIDSAKSFGIVLSVTELNNRVILRLATNEQTYPTIQDKLYKLIIHNGSEIRSVDIDFNSRLEIVKSINYNDLFSGINILTLFDDNNVPLLERLYFNYNGINLLKLSETMLFKEKDSTLISIPVEDIDTNEMNNFSMSVLPVSTNSYNHGHNIISYLYLHPYVKGYIENAQYYFTDITRKKKLELDNLLLSQGWCSYDWGTIFNHNLKTIYDFEIGVRFKATANQTRTGMFVLFPLSRNRMETFEITEINDTFEINGLFPFDDETIKLSEIRKNSKIKSSEIYAQFFPSAIPDFEKFVKTLPLKEQVYYSSNEARPIIENSWTDIEQLDEVIISVNKEQERIEKLKNTSWGDVDVFDNSKRNSYIDFASYIRTKGFFVEQNIGELIIYSQRSGRNTPPTIYIDDRLLFSLDELFAYRLDFIDYIIVDHSGFGEGLRGAGGVIKIYTDPLASDKDASRSVVQEIKIPLTFSSPSKFYTPKYNSYQSQFFQEYGVIDWFPNKRVDENGTISFKISNHLGSTIKLFIEGTANDGSFISEVKTVEIN